MLARLARDAPECHTATKLGALSRIRLRLQGKNSLILGSEHKPRTIQRAPLRRFSLGLVKLLAEILSGHRFRIPLPFQNAWTA